MSETWGHPPPPDFDDFLFLFGFPVIIGAVALFMRFVH